MEQSSIQFINVKDNDMRVKEVITKLEKEQIRMFLSGFGLEQQETDYTIYLEESQYQQNHLENKIIGTVSSKDNIITSFAILEEYQNDHLATQLISVIIKYLFSKGYDHQFIYTKPIYQQIFESMAFHTIAKTEYVLLLESNHKSIEKELYALKENYHITEGSHGAIVMNANPFTNGHLYLIEQASLNHDLLVVFIVEEDKSEFTFLERFYLVKEGTKHLNNIVVIPSSKYIVSSLTFPTYFLKQDVNEVMEQAYLDAIIFRDYYTKIFHITKRYVGSETDLVTKQYNQALKEVFQSKLIQISRKEMDGQAISASRVRKLLKEGKLDQIIPLVPDSTYQHLCERRERFRG